MTAPYLEQVFDNVPLAAVRIDGGTQARTQIDEATVADYAEALRSGTTLPPAILYYDGADFWLADGFHRYHASQQAGLDGLSAEIRTGTRRDAVLAAVGANAVHGLRRTNADKRRAVTMLLDDPEWVQWSNVAIAQACGVSDRFVGEVRKTIVEPFDDSAAPATRTVSRNGTVFEQKVKTKPVSTKKPENSGELAPPPVRTEFASGADTPKNTPELPADTNPGIATPRLTPEQGAVAVTEMDALREENAALREEVADLKADLRELLSENEDIGRILEADDQIKAALAEVARYKALAENAERTLAARSHEFNERARNVVYWKNRAEKAEKLLAKAA